MPAELREQAPTLDAFYAAAASRRLTIGSPCVVRARRMS